jgi:hypothetical protein
VVIVVEGALEPIEDVVDLGEPRLLEGHPGID